jgi:hypothetical protein
MNCETTNSRQRFGCMVPAIAGIMLASCTASAPVQQPYTATLDGPEGGYYRNGGFYGPSSPLHAPSLRAPQSSPYSMIVPSAEAQTVQAQPPPLRSIEPEPAAQPVDSSCGWWRLCNLWKSSGS